MYGRGHEQGTRTQRPMTERMVARDESVHQAVWKGLEAEAAPEARSAEVSAAVAEVREAGYRFCTQRMLSGAWPHAHEFIATQGYDDMLRHIETLVKTVRDEAGIAQLRAAFNQLSLACKAGRAPDEYR